MKACFVHLVIARALSMPPAPSPPAPLSPAPAPLSPPPAPRTLPASVQSDNVVRYFAFGSNLDPEKMASRGKNSSAIPYVARWPCVAHGFRLAFNMRGFPPLEPAMASIAESDGEACPGCVYEMAGEAYEALWRSEGGAMPRSPYREVVVRVTPRDGPAVDAITLAAEDWARLRNDAMPSARYLGIIERGARGLGFEAHADHLATMPRADPSILVKVVAASHGTVNIGCYRLGWGKILAPVRAACYACLYGGRSRLLRLLSEAALVAVLLPGALAGVAVRAVRRALGLPPLTFAPPS